MDELHISRMSNIIEPESLNMQKQKKANFACRLSRLKTGSGKLAAASVASHSGTRKLYADPVSVSSSPVFLSTKRTVLSTERK